jgi:hypothetical protein
MLGRVHIERLCYCEHCISGVLANVGQSSYRAVVSL